MSASSILVTKAGPGTIAEAAALSLPTLMTSFLPGQEAGNVDVVLEKGFGDYVKDPKEAAAVLTDWCNDEKLRRVMSNNAKQVGDAGAAERIAKDVWRDWIRGKGDRGKREWTLWKRGRKN